MKNKAALIITTLILAAMLAACGSSYEYQFGDMEWYSKYAEQEGTFIKDSYYYSDDWFSSKPESENTELALASIQLTAAAVTDDENGPAAVFLRGVGFDEVGFSDFGSTDPEDFNYTWGRKTVSKGSDEYTLVAVAVQSATMDKRLKCKGWKQNFTVNDPDDADPSGEHFAYSRAVDKMVDEIAALGNSDKVKYWITGESRGGAIANVLSVRLAEKLGDKNAGIFTYTFETPATVDEADKGDYKYIHNYICSDDIITMVPMWGMTRYGVVHELKTKETDEGLAEELSKLGSEAADMKPRIVTEKVANEIAANMEKKIPTRADYSAKRTDTFTALDGTQHEVTYSYQEALVGVMDYIFSGDSEDTPVSKLASKKNDLNDSIDHFINGLKLENSGSDPCAEYWAGTEGLYAVFEEISGEDAGIPLEKEDLYKFVRLLAPVLIEIPEDGGEASTELLTDVIGYNKELIYSHMFDTIIARLHILAPTPEK